ncbi:MFS transporter [Streptomyces sp. NPDC090093]|uniref:MFS transporter n=1 Tax=Streptomyces sp. NPDC090093 TaxID=3365945 RepID=UPI003830270A
MEINEVATLLRQWLDEAGMNVRALHGALTEDHFPPVGGTERKASRVPAQGRLYDHLSGRVLTLDMARAVIDVTTEDAAVEQARLAQVAGLFEKIEQDPTPAVVPGAVYGELQKARRGLVRAQGEIDKLRHAQRQSDQARLDAQAIAARMYVQLNDMRDRVDTLTRERDRLASQLAAQPAYQTQLNTLQKRLERAQSNQKATAETLRRAEEDSREARRVADEATRLLLEKEQEVTRLREQAAETMTFDDTPPEADPRPEAEPVPEPSAYDIDVEDSAELAVEIARERLDHNRDTMGEVRKEIGLITPADAKLIEGEVVAQPRQELFTDNSHNPPTSQNEPASPPAAVPSRAPVRQADPARPDAPGRRERWLPASGEPLTASQKRVTLAVIYGAIALCSFSASGALLALPQIRDDLALTPNGMQWVITGDLAGLAAGVLWSHPAQARATRKRLFCLGTLALIAGCVLAVAPWGAGTVWLAVGRVLQGLGQGLLLASLPPLLETASCRCTRGIRGKGEAVWQAEAFSRRVWSSYATAFTLAGLGSGLAAGALAQHWGWQWIFYGPAWMSGILLVAGFFFLPTDPYQRAQTTLGIGSFTIPMRHMTRNDLEATALRLAALLAFLFGTGQGLTHPWYTPFVLGPILIGIYLTWIIGAPGSPDEERHGSSGSSSGNASQRLVAIFDAQILYTAPVYLVLCLYDALGFDIFTIAALMSAVLIPQPAAGLLTRRLTLLGRRLAHGAGLLCSGAGLLLMSHTSTVNVTWTDPLVPLLMIGVGSMAIRTGHSPATMTFPQSLWSSAYTAGAVGVMNAVLLLGWLVADQQRSSVTATNQQIFAQVYGGVFLAAALCAAAAALLIAVFPAASGAEPRRWPASVVFLLNLTGSVIYLLFALLPACMAAIAASGFRQALDTSPEPDLSFLILYVLLALVALALATYVLVNRIVRERGDAMPGKEWSRYTDVLTRTARVGAVAGIPLGAFINAAPLATTGLWFADLVGLL